MFDLIPVIGLSGYKQAGKDTVFLALSEYYQDVRRLAFADPLKEELAAACGVTKEEIEKEKERYRLGLQWWGTEFRRGQSPHYWIDQARIQYLRAIKKRPTAVVFTDCRFPNEVELIKELGGKMWRIERPSENQRRERYLRVFRRLSKTVPKDRHASEVALDGYAFDRVISETDINQLRAHAVRAFEEDFR